MRACGGLGAPHPPPWALARGLQPPPRLLPGPRGDTAESLPAAGTILTCNRTNAGFLSHAHHVWAEAEVPWAPEGFMKGLLCALERELPPPPRNRTRLPLQRFQEGHTCSHLLFCPHYRRSAGRVCCEVPLETRDGSGGFLLQLHIRKLPFTTAQQSLPAASLSGRTSINENATAEVPATFVKIVGPGSLLWLQDSGDRAPHPSLHTGVW